MDKYVEEAFWMAMENAVRDRQQDSIRRILDQLEVLAHNGQNAFGDSGKTKVSAVRSNKPKIPHGTTAKLKGFVEENKLFEQFLAEALSLSNVFAPHEFRAWLEDKWGKQLDEIAAEWREVIGTLIKYYSSPNNELYKQIKRVGPGQYTILNRINSNASPFNLFA